jgi:PmbA protein
MEIERALNLLAKHVDEAEIYCAKERSKTVEIKKGEVDLFKESVSKGYGIRVIKEKRMGFAFSNRLDESVIESALDSAKIAEVDRHLALPGAQSYGKGGGFDQEIEALDTDALLEFVRDLVAPCKDYSVIPTSGSIAGLSYEEKIANTNGVYGEDGGTAISAHLSTVAKDTDVSTGFYYDISRFLDLDFEEIGREASSLARSSVNAERIETLRTNLILKPHAVSELFEHALMPSFSADNVQRNRSFLGEKVDEKIAMEIDITDDGTLKNGLLTGKFDSEGVFSKETPLVKSGVLCGFLHDTYTANKAGIESTSNASRDSFLVLPQIGSTNTVVSGKGDIGEGLVVHGLIGAHTANHVSGDFACETRNAFLNGRPVKKAIISGNVFELLKNVSGFGKDVKQFSHIVSPSIAFSDVTVVG